MKRKFNLNVIGKIFLLASFLIPFVIYLKTLCPTLSSYADAGEFPTFAYISGFAHPPGYPLYILILKLFLLLPVAGSVAMKANLASAFISAACVALTYLWLRRLKLEEGVAFTTSQILAFTPIFWRNALISEVFGLLTLFIVLTNYMYLRWTETGEKRDFYLFLFFCGLGLSHHQLLMIALVPLLVHFIITKKWKLINYKNVIIGIALFLIGFLPYLYILLYSAPRWPLMNWNNPSSLVGLKELITRSTYGTFTLTNQYQASDLKVQAWGILKLIYSNYSLFGIVLFPFGLIYLLLKKKWGMTATSLFVIIAIFLFSLYSGMPVLQNSQIQYLERFQLASTAFMILIIAFGISFFRDLVFSIKPLRVPVLILFMLIPAGLVYTNYAKVDQSKNYFADNLADDIFASIPKDSIFLMEGDNVINDVFYNRYVLGQRKDIIFIIGGLMDAQSPWYLQELRRFYPDLVLPEVTDDRTDYLDAFLAENSIKRQIILYLPSLENDLGIYINKVNRGIVWKFVREDEEVYLGDVQDEILALTGSYKNLKGRLNYTLDSPEYALLNLYTQPYIYLAQMNDDDPVLSEEYYKKALAITPDNYQALTEMGDDYLMYGEYEKAVASWKQALNYIYDSDLRDEVLAKIDEYQNQ